MAAKGWITIHVHTYSIQSHNKYESMSLVVGEAIAYKQIFKPAVLSKITGNLFADLRRSVIDGSRISGIK